MANESDSSASGAAGLGGKEAQSASAPSVVATDSDAAVADTAAGPGSQAGHPVEHPAVVVYGVPSGLGAAPANDGFNETVGSEGPHASPGDAHSVLMELGESGYESLFSGLSDDLLKEGLEAQPAAAEPAPSPTDGESFLLTGLDIADLITDFDHAQGSGLSDQDAALFDHYLATVSSPAGYLVPENVTIEIDDDPGPGVVA